MVRRHPPLPTRAERAVSPAGGFDGVVPVGVSDATIESYNERLSKFHRDYATYYVKLRRNAELRRLFVPLAFRLKNAGTASATHLQIVVRLPEGLTALEAEPNFDDPEAPTPPGRPAPFGITGPTNLNPARFRPSGTPYLFDPPQVYDRFAAEIDAEGQTVRWERDRLQHGPPEDFDALPCRFAEALIGTTMRIEVEIYAEELLKPERFDLVLRIAKRDDTAAVDGGAG
jgi:hypothetical protein